MPKSTRLWQQSGLVALGAVLGVFAREALVALNSSFDFYGATSIFLINLIGATLLGVALRLGKQWTRWEEVWRPFLTTGALGGFTTTSAFAVLALILAQSDSILHAFFYVVGSVGFSALGFKFAYEIGAEK